MRPKVFLSQLNDRRIVEAIASAERRSSGEIRVFVSDQQVADALEAAKRQFVRLGMEATHERNGVLIYFAPRSRNFAIIGDVAVHRKCGDEFWREIAAAMEDHLKENRYTEALLVAVERVGTVLGESFPRRPDDQNELPNEIAGD